MIPIIDNHQCEIGQCTCEDGDVFMHFHKGVTTSYLTNRFRNFGGYAIEKSEYMEGVIRIYKIRMTHFAIDPF